MNDKAVVRSEWEKVAGKLADVCYMAKGFIGTVCRDRNQDPNETEIYRSICAALAEYEKEK